MMHHDGTEHHIESFIWKIYMFDHPNLEFHGQVESNCLCAGDLMITRVNANNATCFPNARRDFYRQRSSAATHIQHFFSGLNAGEVCGLLPKLSQFTAKQEGVEEPLHQVVTPACIEDQSSCNFLWRFA